MKLDVFVKDEGYGEVKFLTKKARAWAQKQGIPNSLSSFAKEGFCGQKVYIPNVQDGLYHVGIKHDAVQKLVVKMQKEGLKVESEI